MKLIFLQDDVFCQSLSSTNIRFDPVIAENFNFESTVNAITQDSKGFMWFGTWTGFYKYDGLKFTLYKPDNKPGNLKDTKIRTTFTDSRGRLWVGTMNEGLHLYDPINNSFLQYKHDPANKNSISNNDILSIYEDRQGNIWFGTMSGLNLLNQQSEGSKLRFVSYHITKDAGANRFNSIYEDHLNRLWFATESGLFWAKNSSDLKFIPFSIKINDPNEVHYNYIYCIASDTPGAENKFWIGTRAGVASISYNGKDGSDFTIDHYESGKGESLISHNRVRALLKYDKTTLWVGTENGLNRLETSTGKINSYFSKMTGDGNLNSNSIFSLYKDYSGILWIGSEKGVNKFDPYYKHFTLFQSVRNNTGLINNYVTSFAASSGGSLWIGTSGDGLHKMERDTATGTFSIQPYKLVEKYFNKSSDFIYCLASDNQGNIWVGTKGSGIYTFSPEKIKKGSATIVDFIQFTSQPDNPEWLNDDYVLSIFNDSYDNIWIGTWSGGIIKYDPSTGKFQRFKDQKNYPADLSSFPITMITEDYKGNIWIGTRGGGLFMMEPQIKGTSEYPVLQFKNILNDENSLSNNFINAIVEDTAKQIWIGTEGGLNLLKKGDTKFINYTEKDGLPNDVIQAIVQDENGHIWISSNKGIAQFDPSRMPEKNASDKLSVRIFDQNDGLQGEMFNNNAAYLMEDGYILFGGTNGFNGFYPENIRINPYSPKVVFTDFQIFNKSVPVGPDLPGKHVIISKPISENPIIHIRPNENAFSFEFAALHFASPGKNKYKYKMEGFDKDWIYTSAKRNFAYYTNLNPGTYTFMVKASNNDGIWNENPTSVTVTVLPPFWRTTWAYIIYALFIVLMLLMLRKWILVKAEYRHRINLERVKRENAEYITQLKLHFFTNVSHEIRTPMTLIIGSIERLINSADINARIHDQLLVLQNNGHRLLKLINQLLDFRKIEAGHMKLQAAKGNIICFLEETYVSFKELAVQRNINFLLETPVTEFSLYYDREKLEKIIFNLLSNAFKYTPENGYVSILFEEVDILEFQHPQKDKKLAHHQEGYVKITVKDTGIGISEEAINHIFELYYREEHHGDYLNDNVGTGIGLTLTKNLVELHQGFIEVTSNEGKGSSFIIYLPKGKNHLKQHEIVHDYISSESSEHYKLSDETLFYQAKPLSEHIKESAELPVILVVEDNLDVRQFIKQTFDEHYKVITAANGQQGWELAVEYIPDLIISDVVMPVMDGLEFSRRIKNDERTSHIPLILLTARTSLLFKTKGLETGADDYMTKPFNYQILFQKVKNLITLKQNISARFGNKKYLSPKDVTSNPQDENFLQKAIDIVEQNMQEPEFSVENFGKELGMSKMQVYRKLKALTGLAPNEFVRNLRLQRAAQLLDKKELNVSEITYQVGFTDLKYFRKCFKDYFHVNPSEYSEKAAELPSK